MSTSTIRPFYDMWPQYNRRLREVIAVMTDEQLATSPSPDRLPVWATVGHTAAMRVYWICHVIGEPGAETTPFGAARPSIGRTTSTTRAGPTSWPMPSIRPSDSSRAAWIDGPRTWSAT